MREKSFKSSIALLKDFTTIYRRGKLFNLWHAAYHIIESGICLLASVLTGMESSDQDRTRLEGEDITIVTKCIKTFPFLLWGVSRRWPAIGKHASALETISRSVLEKLQQWSSGKQIESTEFQELKERLNQVSLFSPFPLEEQVQARGFDFPQVVGYGTTQEVSPFIYTDTIPSTGIELPPVTENTTGPMNAYHGFDSAGFKVPLTDAVSFNPGWEVPQALPLQGASISPEYSSAEMDAMNWGIGGMGSEEIVLALLAGGDLELPNDFTDADTLPPLS
jgi:hypothetical protein